MGPRTPPWDHCPACAKLRSAGTPPALMQQVVPVSIAPRPGPWYNRLVLYKGGYPEYRAFLAALVWSFLVQHEHHVAAMLGGAPTAIVPVPSKRGRTFSSQPLRQAISM